MESRYKAMGVAGILEFDPEAAVVGSSGEQGFYEYVAF